MTAAPRSNEAKVGYRWDEERVNAELDKKMSRAYNAVREVATEFPL